VQRRLVVRTRNLSSPSTTPTPSIFTIVPLLLYNLLSNTINTLSSDEYVIPGNIIFRQRGTLWHPGENVGLGRDHTIFATASGYVKYYRNPRLDPKKRYIGVVFEKSMMLPTPTNAARRRKLGMIAVPRQDLAIDEDGEGVEIRTNVESVVGDGGLPPMSADPEQSMSITQAPSQTKAEVRAARARTLTGRPPTSSLTMSRGNQYSFRESNYSIGRAAERAGLQVKQFVKGDRFLAWRKKEVRKAKNAERRSLGKKKGSARAGKAVRKA
jgi:large subunit ribosomal protein L27